jgi:hypothetical protein
MRWSGVKELKTESTQLFLPDLKKTGCEFAKSHDQETRSNEKKYLN